MQLLFGGQMGRGTKTTDHGKRHHNRPSPRTHLENIEGRPIRQQQDFRGDVG